MDEFAKTENSGAEEHGMSLSSTYIQGWEKGEKVNVKSELSEENKYNIMKTQKVMVIVNSVKCCREVRK